MIRVLFAVLLLAGGVCAQPESGERRFGVARAGPKDKGAVRLVSYNVLNLFDDRDDPSLTGRSEDIDDAKPESERKAVGAAIRAIKPDILALQEIESYSALVEFREDQLRGMGFEHVVSVDAGDGRGIENAVMSRHPIRHVELWPGRPLGGVHPEMFGNRPNWFAGEPLEFRRSPLRVDIDIAGENGADPYVLTLIVVHHKSARGNEYWREAEARMVVSIAAEIEAEHPGRNISVLGDFNAVPTDESMRIYDSAGFHDTFEHRTVGDPRFVTHESGRTIDYIMVNDAMRPELVDGARWIVGTPARPAGADWRTTPAPAGFASDHYPVVVDLMPHDR